MIQNAQTYNQQLHQGMADTANQAQLADQQHQQSLEQQAAQPQQPPTGEV